MKLLEVAAKPYVTNKSGDITYRRDATQLVGPERCFGNFHCDDTKITSLQGASQRVEGSFDCSNTKITSLEGAPQYVGGNLICNDTNITSLQGAHKYLHTIIIRHVLFLPTETTHLLGLLLCPGIQSIVGPGCSEIMRKYLQSAERDIHLCQNELIQAGFIKQARL